MLSMIKNQNFEILKKVQQSFGHSAKTYGQQAQLQIEVGKGLVSALNVAVNPKTNETPKTTNATSDDLIGIDLGCGPGLFHEDIKSFASTLLSLDLSLKMLDSNPAHQNKICADSHNLPVQSNSVDWVFSNLMIQWCDISVVLTEIHRVLKPGATAVVSTLMPGSLYELEQAWQDIDNDAHIHQYQNAKEITVAIEQHTWAATNISDYDCIYWYKNARDLAKELKSLGANVVNGRAQKGLMGKDKWKKMEDKYHANFYDHHQQGISATYKVRTLVLQK